MADNDNEPTDTQATDTEATDTQASEPQEVVAEAEAVAPSAPEAVAEAAKPAPAASRPPTAKASVATSDGAAERENARKVREGLVVSIKMDKTAVVAIVERVRHPRYAKTVQRTKRLYAHDEANDTRVGDRVRLAETRPLSKLKRWRVVEVLERAK